MDIGIDFHSCATNSSQRSIELEPYKPWFYEEVVQALNVDVMAELAKKTHIPSLRVNVFS